MLKIEKIWRSIKFERKRKDCFSLSHNFQRRVLLSIKCSDYSVSSLYNQHGGSISAIIMHLVREIPSHKDTYRPYTLIQKASFAKVILNPCRNVGQFVFYKIHCQVKHRPHITSCSTTNELLAQRLGSSCSISRSSKIVEYQL